MANHKHIQLVDYSEPVDFEAGRYPRPVIVERDETAHSTALRCAYEAAIDSFQQGDAILQNRVEPVNGSYLNFKVAKASMVENTLDTASGAQLMNVRPVGEDGYEEEVMLYLPLENNRWFTKKLNEYNREPKETVNENGEVKRKNRRNRKLVNAVSDIQAAELRHFFSSREELRILVEADVARVVEIWFSEELFNEAEVHSKLAALGIEHGVRTLAFNSVAILLVRASSLQLRQILHALSGITEFRLYRSPSVLIGAGEIEAEEWAQLIQNDVIKADDPLTRIAVLDTGINPHHRLLADYLPSNRCFSAIASGNTLDQENHGTGIASLALYGDFTDVIYNNQRVKITSDLTSVKMLSANDGERNMPEMYAIVTEDAINIGRNSGACILCTAVTDKDNEVLDARASSTSSAIDDSLYNNGACDSVLLISAGNVERTGRLQYPDFLYLKNIQDPAQAWNAITVGAYTKKVAISDPAYRGLKAIAPVDGLSPFSSTSIQWGANAIKPEIVMEGGNAVLGIDDSLDTPDDLSLVVAHSGNGLVPGLFGALNATSAATGLAARLASKIQYYNPKLSALSIRALLIHSAEWTDQMKTLCSDAHGNLNKKMILHSCGYGVPDEKKAIVSSDSRVTFISEDTIKPFVMGVGNKLKFGKMNLYQMPWPKELLAGMDEQSVRLKITLSYYIKPSPGLRSRFNKYSFQSIRLKFDVCGPHESRREFENRIKCYTEEGEERGPRDSALADRWHIGINNRNQGSIISDSFVTTGAEMAGCGIIAVYPSGGWFKNKPENLDIEIPYSLVVTLEGPEEEVHLYNEVENTIAHRVQVEIPIESR